MIIKKYDLYTKKEIDEQKIAVLANVNLKTSIWDDKSLEIINTLDKINPTGIFIPGNLYNDPLENNAFIKNFLNALAEIATVYYAPGDSEIKSGFIPVSLYLNNNPKLYILGEFFARTNFVNIPKENISISSFELNEELIRSNTHERVELLLTKYSEYIKKIIALYQNETFNIMLCQDPTIIKLFGIIEELSKIDLVLSYNKFLGMNSKQILGYTCGVCENGQTNFISSEGIISTSKPLKKLGNFQDSTIEVARIRKKDN